MENEIESKNSYLSFMLGKEIFATRVVHVKEILELTKITKVPQSPAYMKGVINLRGEVLPVIDTRLRLGLGQVKATVNTCIMVVTLEIENEQIQVGALVDAVLEVFEIDDSEILPAPTIGNKYKSEFISGMYKLQEQFIMLINLSKVFSSEELSILQESADELTEEVPDKKAK